MFYYCSEDHQLKHWRDGHYKDCKNRFELEEKEERNEKGLLFKKINQLYTEGNIKEAINTADELYKCAVNENNGKITYDLLPILLLMVNLLFSTNSEEAISYLNQLSSIVKLKVHFDGNLFFVI